MNKIRKKEVLRFLIGGGSAVAVDFIVYHLLMECISVDLSKAISYVVGATVGFVINKLWTFESKSFRTVEVVKYILLYACSAAVNAGVNRLVLSVFANSLLAFLCATGVSTVMNFLGQKFFVFQ